MNLKCPKFGLIGFGKRVKTFYCPILKYLESQNQLILSGFTKKTKDNCKEICSIYSIDFFSDLDSLLSLNLDVIIVSVPAHSTSEILNKLKSFQGIVLIDTPVLFDTRTYGLNIFAIEQWTMLPIEQFKKKILDSNLIGDCVLAENDTRTFQYHGIAQLRNLFDPKDEIIQINNFPSIVGGNDLWSIGSVKFNSGKGFLYKFSYFSKKSKTRPQQLKIYTTNGGIISGCLNEKGNDYEILNVYSDEKQFTVSINRSENLIKNKETSFHSGSDFREISSISCENISWDNCFSGSTFNDQEIAIASIFTEAIKAVNGKQNNLIDGFRAYEDYIISSQITR